MTSFAVHVLALLAWPAGWKLRDWQERRHVHDAA